MGQVLLRYSDPCITHYSQGMSVLVLDYNLDTPARRSVFDRVINQDQKQAPERMRICLDPNRLLRDVLLKINLFGLGQGSSLFARVTNDLRQIRGSELKCFRPIVSSG